MLPLVTMNMKTRFTKSKIGNCTPDQKYGPYVVDFKEMEVVKVEESANILVATSQSLLNISNKNTQKLNMETKGKKSKQP